ncbi:MAG: hypothetical protein HFE72_13550 [Emergencia sp.]|nr:hypothetical protein [Emergencia sp.]
MNEYVRVLLLNLPVEIDGRTVICADDTYIIMINARFSHERQCRIYDREIGYIDNHQLHRMIPASALEGFTAFDQVV